MPIPKSKEKFWRVVKNQAIDGQPNTADIYVLGYIAADWWDAWLPDDTYPLQFAQDLKSLSDVGEIHLRINSLGGDVFSAYAMSAMLRDHSATVIAHIDGVAASAATILALAAADKVVSPSNASFLIHLPSFNGVSGNENELRAYADELSKLKEGLVAVYQAKTGMGRDEIIGLMEEATWMTAQEASDYGFIDTIESPIPIAASIKPGRFLINGTEIDLRGAREWPDKTLADAQPASEESGAEIDGDAENPEAPENPEASAEEAGEEPESEVADPEHSPQQEEPTDPVAIERQRVADILTLTRPGAEEIIADGIQNGSSRGEVAWEILHSQSVKNATALSAKRADAPKLEAKGEEPEESPQARKVGLVKGFYEKLTNNNRK